MVAQSPNHGPAHSESAWITVGRIKTVYGVRGWLKLESFTEPPGNILDYLKQPADWRLVPELALSESPQAAKAGQTAQATKAMQLDDAKLRNKDILVHFEGVDDREAAQRFSRHFVQVAATALPATTEGDYYWHQLEGLQVYQLATNGHDEFLLGEVDYLLATGANDVLVVRRENGEGEVLIPFRPGAVVKSVDLAKSRMLVDWYYDD